MEVSAYVDIKIASRSLVHVKPWHRSAAGVWYKLFFKIFFLIFKIFFWYPYILKIKIKISQKYG